jgi:hypothetical protein
MCLQANNAYWLQYMLVATHIKMHMLTVLAMRGGMLGRHNWCPMNETAAWWCLLRRVPQLQRCCMCASECIKLQQLSSLQLPALGNRRTGGLARCWVLT